MEDWEDEEFEPAPPALKKKQPKGMWDDEDADDQDVKESWEDEEDTAKETKQETPAEKTIQKPGGKAAVGKKVKQPEAVAAKSVDEVLADPVAEKLRQQRLLA